MTYDEQKYNRWKAQGPDKQQQIHAERIMRMQNAVSIAMNSDSGRDKAIAVHSINADLNKLGVKQGYFAPKPAKLPSRKLTLDETVWPEFLDTLDLTL